MKLFKDITIKEKLATFEIPDFDQKIAIIKTWSDDYHHGSLKTDKETSRAGGYNQAIFSDVLGYVRKPSPQATFDAEYSLQGKFPDGVLGYFHTDDEKDNNVCAVVELKGAAIPLDQPQKREKNYTPIEQGFGYKRLLRNCPFVIVSNFYELRLYNDNEIDYEIWTLDDLLDPADDYLNFKKFYYLLCAEHLIAETGSSKTESLMSDIRLEEQSITKKFYADYKSRRHLLLQNLYRKNEVLRNDTDLLIEMGQKLIDRVIFMCFAEDRGLLPADILQTIKRDFEKSAMVETVWDSLKIAFNYVNKGNENWGIPDGYNGGLFARDDRFDDLKVEGHVLSKIIDFGMYDFADQLSVTILGHIFEQSISDLEEIKEKIEDLGKAENEITEAKTSKRKKDGIFYTPEYIVDYIVKNSLGAYLREHETQLIEDENLHDELSEREYQKREQVVYTKYQTFLTQVKVLDPACGSGAFLVHVFDYLLEENRRVGKILGGLFNTDAMYKSILQNNIYGVDLNAESVEITKLSLWLKSAQKGKKLSNLDNNIKCGNSLIDDPAVAGDKAFNWEDEFPFLQCHCECSAAISESKRKCHCEKQSNLGFDVIVGNPPYVRSRELFSSKEKEYLTDKFPTSSYQLDLYKLFIEKSSILLVKKGYLSFITPSVFLVNESDILLRKFILDRYSLNIIATTDENIFGDASVKVVVFVLKNQEPLNNYICFFNIIKSDFLPDKEIKQNFFIKQGYLINEKINHNSIPIIDKIKDNLFLGELFEVKNGIKVRKELLSKKKSDNDFKLFVLGKNISPYYLSFGDNYINYKIENQKLFSNQAFRNKEIFEQNKLIIRQILGKRIVASFDNHNLFTDQTTYVVNNNNPHHLLKFLLCILGSRAMYYYFINTASDNKLLFPKIKRSQLLDLPIVSTDIKIQKLFEEKADAMLALNKKFHEQSPRFLQRMIDNYGLEKANKKLEKFWELDFGDFVKEMRKKGANVALSTQDELQDYFDIKKSELLELDAQIKSTDAEINTMVYELYGLNDDEIKIIENS